MYDLLKFITLSLIKDTLNKNKFLIWSNINTKFIDQFEKDTKVNSKKITSLKLNLSIRAEHKIITISKNLFKE